MKTANYSIYSITFPIVLLLSSLASAESLYDEDFSQGEAALDVWTNPWSAGPNSVSVGDGAMLVTGSRVDLITGDPRVAGLATTSVRARVSLDGNSSGGLGLMTNGDPDNLVAYQAGIDPDDSEFYLGWNDPSRFHAFATAPTAFDLFGGDEFNMQFDVFARDEGGYDMKFWAWPAGDSMPDSPQLTYVDTSVVLEPGEPGFLFDNLAAPGESTARIHEFQVSNQSIDDSITVVAPPGLDDVFGNDFGLAPTAPVRLQWVYDGEYFSDFESPLSISGIAWRPNNGSPSTEAVDNDVLIRLSTTSLSELETRFSANVGTDEQQVFRGPLRINSAANPSPSDFDLAAEFDAPFVFDPSQGNLLVDVTFSGFDNAWRVDNQEFGDGVTRLIVGDLGSETARNRWAILTPMQFTFESVSDPTLACDFDGDGVLGAGDLDLLMAQIASGDDDSVFDINRDQSVDTADLELFVTSADKLNTWIGDANLDGEFNSGDLVAVFQSSLYETGRPAEWQQGDWNGDGKFNSGDLVAAFQAAGYEQGTRPQPVPEPAGLAVLGCGLLGIIMSVRGRWA